MNMNWNVFLIPLLGALMMLLTVASTKHILEHPENNGMFHEDVVLPQMLANGNDPECTNTKQTVS